MDIQLMRDKEAMFELPAAPMANFYFRDCESSVLSVSHRFFWCLLILFFLSSTLFREKRVTIIEDKLCSCTGEKWLNHWHWGKNLEALSQIECWRMLTEWKKVIVCLPGSKSLNISIKWPRKC